MFIYGFTKAASDKKRDDSADVVSGVASGAAGGLAVKKSVPLVTGRTTLYHGTTLGNAKKILKEGLRPNSVVGGVGITGVVPDYLNADNYVYMTPRKTQAAYYAKQAEGLDGFASRVRHLHRAEIARKYAKHPQRDLDQIRPLKKDLQGRTGILEASLPLWKNEFAGKLVKNPELRSPAAGFGHRMILDTPTFAGTVDSHYFKGSPNYKKLTGKEVLEYIKAKPGRFASGLTLGALGLTGIGYGAKKLYGLTKTENSKKR